MNRSPLERCAYILEERLATRMNVTRNVTFMQDRGIDALKYVRRADEAVRVADMILKGGVK